MTKKLRLGSIEKVQAKQDKLAKKFGPETTLFDDMAAKYNAPIDVKPIYFYVYGMTKRGKVVFLGPRMTVQEADNTLAELEDGEIFEYETRDLSKATRQMKAALLERTHDADSAIERVGHKLPERR